jgi:hypothetical protein
LAPEPSISAEPAEITAAAPEPPASRVRSAAHDAVRLLAQRAGLVTGWDVHVYHPEPDGTWLDRGNALEIGQMVQVGDRVKLKATFREPVFAAVVAINPDGSVQRLAAPAAGVPEQSSAELTIPPSAGRYVRLTDPGPTALVLLVSRQPLADPAAIVTSAVDAAAWRASRAESLWTFDGQDVVPILRTRVVEEAVGPKPFAELCERLKGHADLTDARAVVVPVQK